MDEINLGIFIGLSEYKHLTKLDPCKDEANIFSELLKNSANPKVFTFCINNYDFSLLDIDAWNNFVESVRNKLGNTPKINEVIFYFSGHGQNSEDSKGYFYPLLNFDPNQKNAETFITDDAVNEFLISLKPKNLIKIIDACKSGNQSKVSVTEKLLSSSIRNIYLFSSSSPLNPANINDRRVSDYTRVFFNLFLKTEAGSIISYLDLINYLKEELMLEVNYPYFFIKADFKDIFYVQTIEQTEIISSFYDTPESLTEPNTNTIQIENILNKVIKFLMLDNWIWLIDNMERNLVPDNLIIDFDLFIQEIQNLRFPAEYEDIKDALNTLLDSFKQYKNNFSLFCQYSNNNYILIPEKMYTHHYGQSYGYFPFVDYYKLWDRKNYILLSNYICKLNDFVEFVRTKYYKNFFSKIEKFTYSELGNAKNDNFNKNLMEIKIKCEELRKEEKRLLGYPLL